VTVLDLVERIARTELVELLGDVEPPSEPAPLPRCDEGALAARLAAEYQGECWATFAAGAVDAGFAGRALDLFAISAPWLGGDGPAVGAAEVLREIGDGYALLSHPAGEEPLPLPVKPFSEVVIRELGIEAWAAALGSPLEVPEHHVTGGEPEPRDEAFDLAAAVGEAERRHELLAVLADSPTGRTALQSDGFRRFAGTQLAAARRWTDWVRSPEEGIQVQRLILMAEGWFIAAHGAVASSREL